MSSCPRCDEPLAAGVYHDVEVGVCPECSGLLVENVHLVALLDGVARDLLEEVGPDTEIEPAADAGGELGCPWCSQPMENFGYLGTRTVMLDRCGPCGVLWMDPDELGVAALLHARTQAWVDERRSQSARAEAEGMQRFTRMMLARAVSNAIAARMT